MAESNKNSLIIASSVVVGAVIIGAAILFSQSFSSASKSGSSSNVNEKIDYLKAAENEIKEFIERGDGSRSSDRFIRAWKGWTDKGYSLKDILSQDEREKSGFAFVAAECGLINTVKWLVEEGKFDVNTVGDGGMVHRAAWRGQYDVLKYLISKNADLSKFDKDGQAPLSWVLGGKNPLPMVKFLIENGADPQKSSGGRRAEQSLLHEAAEKGDYDVIVYLLESSKLNVNCKDQKGRTAMYYAKDQRIRDLLQRHGGR